MRSAALNAKQAISPLRRAFFDARVVETVENFSRACVPNARPTDEPPLDNMFYFDDGAFWRDVLGQPRRRWNKGVVFADAVIFSEWVARVPGLYWRPESERLRDYSPDIVESYDLGG